jgi:hypothetical protein
MQLDHLVRDHLVSCFYLLQPPQPPCGLELCHVGVRLLCCSLLCLSLPRMGEMRLMQFAEWPINIGLAGAACISISQRPRAWRCAARGAADHGRRHIDTCIFNTCEHAHTQHMAQAYVYVYVYPPHAPCRGVCPGGHAHSLHGACRHMHRICTQRP